MEKDKAVKVVHKTARERGLDPECIEALMEYVTGKGKEQEIELATQNQKWVWPQWTIKCYVKKG